jgi:hypothetical protein
MEGEAKKGVPGRHLDDDAEIHDRYHAADVLDHAEIMADEEVGQVKLPPQVRQQIEDLSLNGYVEGRDRFIGDKERRVKGQGPGNADALPLSS